MHHLHSSVYEGHNSRVAIERCQTYTHYLILGLVSVYPELAQKPKKSSYELDAYTIHLKKKKGNNLHFYYSECKH